MVSHNVKKNSRPIPSDPGDLLGPPDLMVVESSSAVMSCSKCAAYECCVCGRMAFTISAMQLSATSMGLYFSFRCVTKMCSNSLGSSVILSPGSWMRRIVLASRRFEDLIKCYKDVSSPSMMSRSLASNLKRSVLRA